MTWSSAGRAYWGLFRDTVFDKKEAAILSEDSYMSQKTFGKQPATTSSYMYSYEKSLSKKTGNLAQVK